MRLDVRGVPPETVDRYLHDAEYHAWVWLVGMICVQVGRWRDRVNAQTF